MKRFPISLIAILFLIGPAFGQEPGAAPTALPYTTGDPSTWPPELESVVAAPKNHKVTFENERVRVLEVTLAPGEVEALHYHQWPSVLYITSAGHFIDRDKDGKVILDTRLLPGPLTLPMTMWKDPEAPHAVENLSTDTPITLIRMELKQ